MATQFDFLLSQVRTVADGALVAGKVYFYKAGTSTAKTIWLDRNESSIAANPYTLDANATAQLYGTGNYRIVIKDSSGVVKFDLDNINSSGVDGSILGYDCTTGDQAVQLPASGSISYVKTDSTSNVITVTPSTGGQTINGLSSDSIYNQGEVRTYTLVDSTWYVG